MYWELFKSEKSGDVLELACFSSLSIARLTCLICFGLYDSLIGLYLYHSMFRSIYRQLIVDSMFRLDSKCGDFILPDLCDLYMFLRASYPSALMQSSSVSLFSHAIFVEFYV